jgi:hypothetical protein
MVNAMLKRRLAAVILLVGATMAMAVESGRCRLLSASESTKIILVSKIPEKVRYALDASTAKITLGGKPAEFSDLKSFAVLIVRYELKKLTKNGIELDGVATEIMIAGPQK